MTKDKKNNTQTDRKRYYKEIRGERRQKAR